MDINAIVALVLAKGTHDTKKYRYRLFKKETHNAVSLEVRRIRLIELDTTATLDRENWELVKVLELI